ncbi:MAG TPA: cobalamin-binding protein [Candidatus Saccharimonadales bacterium]|nr:cobalamin-binding protein [Candidatus Saccharimonadales bacterium]
MRIVSLLPSATETLFALGFHDEIVGVSHECDFPPEALTKTRVVTSRIPKDISPAEIDRIVREHVERGESIYALDKDLLEELKPDLIVTQDLCHVCAATPEELGAVLAQISIRPQVLSLDPLDLGDVWRDILWVGEVTGRRERAQEFVEEIGARLAQIEVDAASFRKQPKAAVLEWLDPIYVGGHWVPEMVTAAGGVDVIGKAKKPSRRVTMEEIIASAPEVLFIAPCGYDAEKARKEYLSMTWPREWQEVPAVRDGRVFALDANAYVSRPAGRLVTGIEAMAKCMHPKMHVREKAEAAILRILEPTEVARGARV